jgi:hypothetical protein
MIPDPSAPLPLLISMVCLFVLILMVNEFKKIKDKD